jgi:hypothetical protein
MATPPAPVNGFQTSNNTNPYNLIDKLKATILNPALTSHYLVYITTNPEVKTASAFNTRFSSTIESDILPFSCSEASLPGSSLATHELNNDFTGVTQRHAYRRLYDDRADFTFYVNDSYEQIRYFESWMRYIVGEQIENSEYIENTYRVRYPKSYKTPFISITKFERFLGAKSSTQTSAKQFRYNFYNAFPISISSMPVSYDSSQLLKVTVSFTYDRYVADDPSTIKNPVGSSPTVGSLPTPTTNAPTESSNTPASSNSNLFTNPNFTSRFTNLESVDFTNPVSMAGFNSQALNGLNFTPSQLNYSSNTFFNSQTPLF